MSPTARQTWVGLGVGVSVASLATVGGMTIGRLWRDREEAIALGVDDDLDVTPTRTAVVVAQDNVPLHVEIDEPDDLDAGRPTFVLSHGYCLDRRCWVYQRRALVDQGYRVLSWDQRGHGLSGRGELENYKIDQLGSDLGHVIAEVAPEGDLVLVGHSMGGMTIMALAEQDPGLIAERVRGVALISTSAGAMNRITWGLGPVVGGAVHKLGVATITRLAGHQDLVDRALRGGKELQEFAVARGSFASPVPLAVVRLAADMLFNPPMDIVSAFVPSLTEHDKVDALQNLIGVEVLVCNGDKDVLTSAEHSEEIVRYLPWAEHVVLSHAGHILMMEHPEVLNRELIELAERAAGGTSGRRPQPRTTVTRVSTRRRTSAARKNRTLPAARRRQSTP